MIPTKGPKYLRIAEDIELCIDRGDWNSGKVPSVRDIASRHGVSVVTASRALQVLRDKGRINTVERSGCYLVEQKVETENWAIVLRVSPGPYREVTESLTRGGFDLLAVQRHLTLVDEQFALRPELTRQDYFEQARRAMEEQAVKGLFFMPSRVSDQMACEDELLLQACDDAGLPIVLIERNLRGYMRPLHYDLVVTDDVEGGRILTNHLLELGRRRIAFVAGSPTSSHYDRLAGYHQAMHAAGLEPLVFWQDATLPSRISYQQLAMQLLEQRPDALVCYQDYTAIGLMLELFARGVTVPRDVALAGFDNLPVGEMFSLGITTYEFPAQQVAEQALRLIKHRVEEPTMRPVKVVAPGRLIVRESTSGNGNGRAHSNLSITA